MELTIHLDVTNSIVFSSTTSHLGKEFSITISFLNPMSFCYLMPANPKTHLKKLFLSFEPFNPINKGERLMLLFLVEVLDLIHQISQFTIKETKNIHISNFELWLKKM